jgi:hypothetical protein
VVYRLDGGGGPQFRYQRSEEGSKGWMGGHLHYHFVGASEMPQANTELNRKQSLLWASKAVALHGIVSCILHQV